LLAIFNGEYGEQIVIDLIEQARAGTIRLYMSVVQLLEVYYDRLYVAGENDTRAIVESILDYSIAAATARSLAATLVTKDSEMKPAEEAGEFSVLWLK